MLPFDPYIPVGEKVISPEHPVFIIAEAGVNHGGDFDLAVCSHSTPISLLAKK